MPFENLMNGESPDPRFTFGLSTEGLKNIFVVQGLRNNCDATARLIVYRYLEKRGRAKIYDSTLKTSGSLNLYATGPDGLNSKVDAGLYEIAFLYGGAASYFNIANETPANSGKHVKGRDYDKGLAYLDTCLKNGIPVIIAVGIPKFSSGNPDGSSDHFIVCVGKGKNGEYYYYDPGTSAGGNLEANSIKPIQSSLHRDELMFWTSSVGDRSGTVYFTFVGIYPIHKDSLDNLSPFSPPVSQISSPTQSGTQSTDSSQPNPTTGVVEQEKSRGEIAGQEGKSNDTQTGPSVNFIKQIVNPKLSPGLIKFAIPPQDEVKKEIKENFGNMPFIYYGSYQIDYQHVEFFQIYTSGNIPSLKLIFVDTLNLMKDKGQPLDDTRIVIFINPRSKQLKPIYLSFKITKFSVSGKTYTIGGRINADLLYVKRFKSFPNKSSFETMRSVAEEIGLGFASNIDSTNDKMTWINPGQKYVEFLDHVIQNSYISDQTYLFSYIDFYYNLVYVDVEKELQRNIQEELGIGNIGLEEITKQPKELVQKLVITNDKAYSSSNNFFKEYRLLNNSTEISLREGYTTRVNFYDELQKDFLVFNLQSITSDGQNSIILKGSPQDDEFFKQNVELTYLGKVDNDNMYKNFHYSKVQNYRNLVELEKIAIEVTMKTPNFNFYKFQKIFLVISNQTPTPSNSHFNNRLSGEWLILDISYKLENRQFHQIIKLIKKELSLSPEEKKEETIKNKPKKATGRGAFSNPDTGEQDTFSRPEQKPISNSQTADSGQSGSAQATDEPNNTFVPNSTPATTPLLQIVPYKGVTYYYLVDAQNGLAGKRLVQFRKGLEDYLKSNGFPSAVLGSNGIMRDLVAAGNPQKIPARASGSLHGAGLAHDLTFNIPGIKWASINDNANLAKNKKLTSTIWKYVQSQGDITWGAQWGKSVNLANGETNGFGITEYHHFEIKANNIAAYWAPYESEIKKLGYDYKKLTNTNACAPFYITVLNGRT